MDSKSASRKNIIYPIESGHDEDKYSMKYVSFIANDDDCDDTLEN
jgi:hypothetical protein